jgi:hypothetical protein
MEGVGIMGGIEGMDGMLCIGTCAYGIISGADTAVRTTDASAAEPGIAVSSVSGSSTMAVSPPTS